MIILYNTNYIFGSCVIIFDKPLNIINLSLMTTKKIITTGVFISILYLINYQLNLLMRTPAVIKGVKNERHIT